MSPWTAIVIPAPATRPSTATTERMRNRRVTGPPRARTTRSPPDARGRHPPGPTTTDPRASMPPPTRSGNSARWSCRSRPARIRRRVDRGVASRADVDLQRRPHRVAIALTERDRHPDGDALFDGACRARGHIPVGQRQHPGVDTHGAQARPRIGAHERQVTCMDDAPGRRQRCRVDADRRRDRQQLVPRQVRLEEEIGAGGVKRQATPQPIPGRFVERRTDAGQLAPARLPGRSVRRGPGPDQRRSSATRR